MNQIELYGIRSPYCCENDGVGLTGYNAVQNFRKMEAVYS
jgi:hypothetical protein